MKENQEKYSPIIISISGNSQSGTSGLEKRLTKFFEKYTEKFDDSIDVINIKSGGAVFRALTLYWHHFLSNSENDLEKTKENFIKKLKTASKNKNGYKIIESYLNQECSDSSVLEFRETFDDDKEKTIDTFTDYSPYIEIEQLLKNQENNSKTLGTVEAKLSPYAFLERNDNFHKVKNKNFIYIPINLYVNSAEQAWRSLERDSSNYLKKDKKSELDPKKVEIIEKYQEIEEIFPRALKNLPDRKKREIFEKNIKKERPDLFSFLLERKVISATTNVNRDNNTNKEWDEKYSKEDSVRFLELKDFDELHQIDTSQNTPIETLAMTLKIISEEAPFLLSAINFDQTIDQLISEVEEIMKI
jgi:hypothetical protein